MVDSGVGPGVADRSSPPNASPPATSRRSRNTSIGWSPRVFFHLAELVEQVLRGGRDAETEVTVDARERLKELERGSSEPRAVTAFLKNSGSLRARATSVSRYEYIYSCLNDPAENNRVEADRDTPIKRIIQTLQPLRTIVVTVCDQELLADPTIDAAARELIHAMNAGH